MAHVPLIKFNWVIRTSEIFSECHIAPGNGETAVASIIAAPSRHICLWCYPLDFIIDGRINDDRIRAPLTSPLLGYTAGAVRPTPLQTTWSTLENYLTLLTQRASWITEQVWLKLGHINLKDILMLCLPLLRERRSRPMSKLFITFSFFFFIRRCTGVLNSRTHESPRAAYIHSVDE